MSINPLCASAYRPACGVSTEWEVGTEPWDNWQGGHWGAGLEVSLASLLSHVGDTPSLASTHTAQPLGRTQTTLHLTKLTTSS